MNHSIKYRLSLAIAAIVGVATVANADGTVSRADTNQTINIVYGRVASIDAATAQSAATGGAAVGGIIGLATQHGKHSGDKVAGTAGGALLGALLTRAAEGSRNLQAYTIRESNGATVKIIQEPADIRLGDCVAVEQGSTSNVRRVASDMCEAGPHLADPVVTASHAQDADECVSAKRELLGASTDADVARAEKKVHILCF